MNLHRTPHPILLYLFYKQHTAEWISPKISLRDDSTYEIIAFAVEYVVLLVYL